MRPFRESLGTPLARLFHVKNFEQILKSILVLSCEASVNLVCTLGGHDCGSVSVGGLSQDNASFFLIREGCADEY